tara:strand:+ start:25601 stop:26026 length:426 start_codon:yes stop_codon:yes gene_type:complete
MRSIDNIDNILIELNNEIDDYSAKLSHIRADFEMMSRFTYETAGFYCWIKFGDEILWDSENEPRKWNEETNEYGDLTTFIKKAFNKYINTLKRFRFDVEPDDEGYKNSEAFDAADKISSILERDVQDDTFQKIVGIIEKYN